MSISRPDLDSGMHHLSGSGRVSLQPRKPRREEVKTYRNEHRYWNPSTAEQDSASPPSTAPATLEPKARSGFGASRAGAGLRGNAVMMRLLALVRGRIPSPTPK